MSVCRDPGCPGCTYGCRLRKKGVVVAPSAMPSRHDRKSGTPGNNSWERGIAGEHRPDGSFMPLLNEHREPIRMHEQANRRHEIETQVKRLKADPHVFSTERGQ